DLARPELRDGGMVAADVPRARNPADGAGHQPRRRSAARRARSADGVARRRGMKERTAFFLPDGDDRFVATEHGRGPWRLGHLHAGPPSALLARAIEPPAGPAAPLTP